MFRTKGRSHGDQQECPSDRGRGDPRNGAPETVWDVIADIDGWPQWSTDVKSTKVAGPVAVGSVFRWKSGRVRSRPPMGIKAIHVFRLRSEKGGTLVRSEESWEGFIAGLLKGYSRKAIHRAIQHVLSGLKREAERRAAV